MADLESVRTRVHVGKKSPQHTRSFESVHSFSGRDNSFDLEKFRNEVEIRIQSSTEEQMVFDLIGVDTSFANALRRILIAEIPTMAIDKVKLFQNTSILQDEVLCHRLGLLPIKVDPRLFEDAEGKQASELNTLVFTLDVKCTRKAPGADLPLDDLFNKHTIYSKDLEWIPQGKQAQRFEHNPPRPVIDDIIVAKMRPGQVIEAECHVTKGIGSTHTKFSPVCTASYRLMPEIVIEEEFEGEEAEELVKTCPMDVFDIEDMGGGKTAVAARPRNCSMCRECLRPSGWDDKLKLKRVRNHFIFSIESTGVYTPAELFKESLKVLMGKADKVLGELA